jgi:hypothetical protein
MPKQQQSNGTPGKKKPAGPPAAERSIPMVAATAIIWAVGLIIAAYAGTPPSFIVISIVLWFLWIGWQIRQRNPESRWWD